MAGIRSPATTDGPRPRLNHKSPVTQIALPAEGTINWKTAPAGGRCEHAPQVEDAVSRDTAAYSSRDRVETFPAHFYPPGRDPQQETRNLLEQYQHPQIAPDTYPSVNDRETLALIWPNDSGNLQEPSGAKALHFAKEIRSLYHEVHQDGQDRNTSDFVAVPLERMDIAHVLTAVGLYHGDEHAVTTGRYITASSLEIADNFEAASWPGKQQATAATWDMPQLEDPTSHADISDRLKTLQDMAHAGTNSPLAETQFLTYLVHLQTENDLYEAADFSSSLTQQTFEDHMHEQVQSLSSLIGQHEQTLTKTVEEATLAGDYPQVVQLLGEYTDTHKLYAGFMDTLNQDPGSVEFINPDVRAMTRMDPSEREEILSQSITDLQAAAASDPPPATGPHQRLWAAIAEESVMRMQQSTYVSDVISTRDVTQEVARMETELLADTVRANRMLIALGKYHNLHPAPAD